MIAVVAGTRPNFIKVAPIIRELGLRGIPFRFIHTGQHYDFEMSATFLSHLELPNPDYNLEVGSGSHGLQTGKALISLEKVFSELEPDLVVVVGDVNSTLAGALAAVKLNIPVAHVEAGLRSYDRTMPEEINRVVTDSISTLLFTTSEDACDNLKAEGISDDRIHFVGNVMIDSLVKAIPRIDNSTIMKDIGITAGSYLYVTLHRPSNVDSKEILLATLTALRELGAKQLTIVFPLHPRTKKMLQKLGLLESAEDILDLNMIDPVGYFDSLSLIKNAKLVLTDSGGIQEETTYLKVPCLTLRPNTERPITITVGTNTLLDKGAEMIVPEAEKILSGDIKAGNIPELWDGKASQRIVKLIFDAGYI